VGSHGPLDRGRRLATLWRRRVSLEKYLEKSNKFIAKKTSDLSFLDEVVAPEDFWR